jgi:hypothetical protein
MQSATSNLPTSAIVPKPQLPSTSWIRNNIVAQVANGFGSDTSPLDEFRAGP